MQVYICVKFLVHVFIKAEFSWSCLQLDVYSSFKMLVGALPRKLLAASSRDCHQVAVLYSVRDARVPAVSGSSTALPSRLPRSTGHPAPPSLCSRTRWLSSVSADVLTALPRVDVFPESGSFQRKKLTSLQAVHGQFPPRA